uniref:Uncharacterized protein n=1 Tax=Ditylenchus dipsaci TaxID=166011 RepID=A0A915CSD8_9BILA
MGSQYEAMGDIKSDYVIPIKPLRIRQTPAPIHVSPRPMKLQSKNSEVFTPRNDSREYKSADPSASELITGETVLEIEDEDKFIVENRNNSAPPRRGKKPRKVVAFAFK